MGIQEIDVKGETSASPAAVWRLLADSTSWPSWTAIEHAAITTPAGPDGTGEERTFKTGRFTVRERIVEARPEQRLTYEVLGGLPVKAYRAEIDLTPTAAGTAIRWHTTFASKVPGLGGALRRGLDQRTREFVDGLAAAAARGAA